MSDYPIFDEFGANLNDGGDDAQCFEKAIAPDPPEPDPYADELESTRAEVTRLTSELAASEGLGCRMREALERIMTEIPEEGDDCGDDCTAKSCPWMNASDALASSSACPHKAEVKRLRELCGRANCIILKLDANRDDLLLEALSVSDDLIEAEKGGGE